MQTTPLHFDIVNCVNELYINIVEDRILRNSLTNLLATLTLKESITYKSISHIPLPREQLKVKPGIYSKLEMKFELFDGTPVIFNKGTVSIKLEFKKT